MKSPHSVTALFLVLGLGGSLLWSGCRATSGIEGSAQVMPASKTDVALSKYVSVNNAGLARSLQIVDMKASTTENGLLKASVSLISKKRGTREFQYKFSWYDATGIEVEPEASPWKPVIIYGKEAKSLQDVAPNATVTEFRVKLRPR